MFAYNFWTAILSQLAIYTLAFWVGGRIFPHSRKFFWPMVIGATIAVIITQAVFLIFPA